MSTDTEKAWHPASGPYRLAHSIIQGMSELNRLFPNRPQGAQEGTVGDTAHQAEGTGSDHNPNAAGVVRAWDIDCTAGVPFDPQHLADTLAQMMRTSNKYNFFGSKGYVIYNRRITSWNPWGTWVTYNGSDPHTQHIHVSVGQLPAEYDDTETWDLGLNLGVTPIPVPAPTRPIGKLIGSDRQSSMSSWPPGRSIVSANGRYRFSFQTDGNMAIYDGETVIWASNTGSTHDVSGRRLQMQSDGNLVIYGVGNEPHVIWQSKSPQPIGQYILIMQDDGNLVIYNAATGKAIWWTKR